MKQHKPWFDEEYLGILLIDQRKQAKMQLIQDPNENNVDNLNKVRRDASKHFRNKKRAYLNAKIDDLETNSKINNMRDLSEYVFCFSWSDLLMHFCRLVK
jgi:hypothetical protein